MKYLSQYFYFTTIEEGEIMVEKAKKVKESLENIPNYYEEICKDYDEICDKLKLIKHDENKGWILLSEHLPPEDIKCEYLNALGKTLILVRKGNLYFDDGGMYIYYTPMKWRLIGTKR